MFTIVTTIILIYIITMINIDIIIYHDYIEMSQTSNNVLKTHKTALTNNEC